MLFTNSSKFLLQTLYRIRFQCCKISVAKMSSSITYSSAKGLASSRPLVGVVQMTATEDKEATYSQLSGLVKRAKDMGAKIAFVPECADYIASCRDQSLALAEPIDGPTVTKYRELASSLNIWLSVGGFHEKAADTPLSSNKSMIYNTQLMIDDVGKIRAVYRKIHLFDVDIPGGRSMRESDCTLPGNEIVPPVATPIGNIGMAICYDMRFPEMALTLARQGADVLLYPSAFFIPTGMAHWDVLLRSRAIETQCYVIAAAQVGAHHDKRSSYGNAMIVDPWGTVIGRCHDQPDVFVAPIDIPLQQKRRCDLPVSKHRRPDLYDLISPSLSSTPFHPAPVPSMLSPTPASSTPSSTCTSPSPFSPASASSTPSLTPGNVDLSAVFQFGPHTVKGTSVFYVSTLSLAFVNRKPVLPGHVLIASQRVVPRLRDLSPGEVADLFVTAQRVARVVQEHYGAPSCTMAVQDGAEAGQTVPHVHVHVLPRKVGDFSKNDDVYEKLEQHDKDPALVWRSDEDMGVEAETLRKKFS